VESLKSPILNSFNSFVSDLERLQRIFFARFPPRARPARSRVVHRVRLAIGVAAPREIPRIQPVGFGQQERLFRPPAVLDFSLRHGSGS
jgi:hypothetical protein